MDLDEIKRGLRAEIKKRENEQYFTFQCNVRQMCKDVLAKLEEMEAENAELKQKLEDAQASAYAESVDAGMENRRLRRLLWRAIALFCARSCEYFNGIMSHCLMGQDDLYRRCEEKKNKYLNAMYKCRAKVEEYYK